MYFSLYKYQTQKRKQLIFSILKDKVKIHNAKKNILRPFFKMLFTFRLSYIYTNLIKIKKLILFFMSFSFNNYHKML